MHVWNGAGGLRIAGDSWGNPDNPVVLLLHGGGQTRHAWRGTGKRLAAVGFYAVAFDARGHGDSDWSEEGDYSWDAMIADLACIVEALGNRRPALVGASMGGSTSLVAVGEDRIDAGALVLVDIVPRTEPSGFERVRSFMTQMPGGFDSLDEVAEAVSKYRPDQPRPRNTEGLAKNVRITDDGRYRWHWDPRFLASPGELDQRHQRMSTCARRITLPTLLVRGGGSDVVSESGVQEFLELCPHAKYVNILGAGHMVTGDRNDTFGRAVIDFLTRHAVADTTTHLIDNLETRHRSCGQLPGK
jgi:non-heme chloroperoxidase